MQQPGEECFIRALYDLSENCDFGEKKEQKHRRQTYCWHLRQRALQATSLLQSDLTLETAVQMIRQAKYIAEVKPPSNVWHWNLGKRPLGEKMLLQLKSSKVSVSIGHVSALIQELMLLS